MSETADFVIWLIGLAVCVTGGVAIVGFCILLCAEYVSNALGKAHQAARQTFGYLLFRRVQRRHTAKEKRIASGREGE